MQKLMKLNNPIIFSNSYNPTGNRIIFLTLSFFGEMTMWRRLSKIYLKVCAVALLGPIVHGWD